MIAATITIAVGQFMGGSPPGSRLLTICESVKGTQNNNRGSEGEVRAVCGGMTKKTIKERGCKKNSARKPKIPKTSRPDPLSP
jgi:hypothetical protein